MPHSGKYAKILGTGDVALPTITGWKLQNKSAVHQYASSDAPGYKQSVDGVHSGSGSFSALYSEADALTDTLQEGDLMTVKFYATTGKYLQRTIRIESIDIEGDPNEGTPVPLNYSFSTHGSYGYDEFSDSASGASDST